jgi:hypothetical protein
VPNGTFIPFFLLRYKKDRIETKIRISYHYKFKEWKYYTADWHLGKKLDHFSRLEEQKGEEWNLRYSGQNADVVIVVIYLTPSILQ